MILWLLCRGVGRLSTALVCFYLASTLMLAAYGLHTYVLGSLAIRRQRHVRAEQQAYIDMQLFAQAPGAWPAVVSQIPLYNEPAVAERVIRAAAGMTYPGPHHIQILDDSTDGTRSVVDRIAEELRASGADVGVVRRTDRQGYKAGALAYGLTLCDAPLVAVFDADFLPPADFLHRAVALLLRDSHVACLQGRWTHLNADESGLTRAQALGVDTHFVLGQAGRAWNNLPLNFNGTAGVWRRAAIEDPRVGGWQASTVTEDLDLSYRAQLAGWRIDYCLDLPCPGELPGSVDAFKSQQRRWALGSTQCAVKLLPDVWRSGWSLRRKIEATLHLTAYSICVWMIITALLAVPMLAVVDDWRHVPVVWLLWLVIAASTLAPLWAAVVTRRVLGIGWTAWRDFPVALIYGSGMCLNNALAVVAGLVTHGGEFVRTPKSGAVGTARQNAQASPSAPRRRRGHLLWLVELSLGVTFIVAAGTTLLGTAPAVSVFLMIYGTGFIIVGGQSAFSAVTAARLWAS